jgi:gliding motility-associated-like protein
VEFSPLLANPVLAEVALLDEPNPLDGVVEVPLGEPVTLTYDVRAEFTSAAQGGFNGLRLNTPGPVDFQRFEMGEPLVEVQPDSLFVREQSLEIYFPSNPVQPGANVPLRLTFGTRVFSFITLFGGEVFQIGGENLAQSIDAGDASEAVSTNDLRVIAPLTRLEVLSELVIESKVLTPNGDGINDALQLSYTLRGVQSSRVKVTIHDLSGRVVHRLTDDVFDEGRYIETWDGSVDGMTVPPGAYLVRVTVDTDLGTFERIRIVAVAY